MREIRGKTVLVTGAASGIGRAVALRLAVEGAQLLLVDIDELRLAEVVSECRQLGTSVAGRRCDVGQSHEISATVAAALERWGGVDILVNNAGITYYGQTHRMSAENWDRLLNINLHAHIQFTREFLPSMLAKPEAHVLNVCSVLGLVGMPKVNAYCVSKFAMVGFSESLRAEYGRQGLGVTALCPGFVDTKLFENAPLEESASAPKLPPSWIQTTPEKVAKVAVKAIRRNRGLVVMEPFARGLFNLKRFAPGLIDFATHIGRSRRMRTKQIHSPIDAPAPKGLPNTIELRRPATDKSDRPERRAA